MLDTHVTLTGDRPEYAVTLTKNVTVSGGGVEVVDTPQLYFVEDSTRMSSFNPGLTYRLALTFTTSGRGRATTATVSTNLVEFREEDKQTLDPNAWVGRDEIQGQGSSPGEATVRRAIASAALVIAAMGLGRLINDHIPLDDVADQPFVHPGAVDQTVAPRPGRGHRHRRPRDPDDHGQPRLRLGRALARRRHRAARDAAAHDDGRLLPRRRAGPPLDRLHPRAASAPTSANLSTGVRHYASFCFDVPKKALEGARLMATRGAWDSHESEFRRDDLADIDLGIAASEVDGPLGPDGPGQRQGERPRAARGGPTMSAPTLPTEPPDVARPRRRTEPVVDGRRPRRDRRHARGQRLPRAGVLVRSPASTTRSPTGDADEWVDVTEQTSDAHGDLTRRYSVRLAGLGGEDTAYEDRVRRRVHARRRDGRARPSTSTSGPTRTRSLKNCALTLVDDRGPRSTASDTSSTRIGPDTSRCASPRRRPGRACRPQRRAAWGARPRMSSRGRASGRCPPPSPSPKDATFVELRISFENPDYVTLRLPR